MNPVYEWRDVPSAEFAVIGNPIAHSQSPVMHSAIYRELDLPWSYLAVRVPEGEVELALERLMARGFRGVNVTVPHKLEALHWCTHPEPFASKVQAANTINLATKTCINTDAPGFLESLVPLALKGKSALVLGAGGSARALVLALAQTGWDVKIFNRTASRAKDLAETYGGEPTDEADPSDVHLILNTTSSAFDSEAPPVQWEKASPEAVAYDLMYSSEPTPFVAAAKKRGLQTIDGLPLLVAQGALSFEWWTGLRAPREAMKAALMNG